MSDSWLMRGLTRVQKEQALQAMKALDGSADVLMIVSDPRAVKRFGNALLHAATSAGCTVDALLRIAETMRRNLEKQADRERSDDYTGELAVKGTFETGLLLSSAKAQSREKAIAAWEAHRKSMMRRLLDHFAISHDDPECWFKLAVALAERHVPAFQTPEPVGRPKKWGRSEDEGARIAVDSFIKEHPKHSIVSAAAHLAKQPPWDRLLRGSKKPGELLRQAYFRAKRRT